MLVNTNNRIYFVQTGQRLHKRCRQHHIHKNNKFVAEASPDYYPSDKSKTLDDLVLKTPPDTSWLLKTSSSPIDYLRMSHALLNPQSLQPQTAGVMNIITKSNDIPGRHSIEFLPIIDLASTKINCMVTTLDFIIGHHQQLKLPGKPIIGFNQPLLQLAMIVKQQMGLDMVVFWRTSTHSAASLEVWVML